MPVAFVRRIGPRSHSVAEAWGTMLGWLDNHRLRPHITRGFGLVRDGANVAPEKRRYEACVELISGLDEDPAAGIGVKILPGGAFLRQRHQGPLMNVGTAFSSMYRLEAPALGVAVDPTRPFIEIYLDDPKRTARTALRIDLCVPVIGAADTAAQRSSADQAA